MPTTPHRVVAALGALALILSAGCADDSGAPGTRVAEAELPGKLTIELGHTAESPALPLVRTIAADLVSPADVPLAGLKWPRLELPDGSWPPGWGLLPADVPFGLATNGIPAARRFTWSIEILRTSADSPTEGDVRVSLEHTGPSGDLVRTVSEAIRVEFPAEVTPHEVGERDVAAARGGDFLLRVTESRPGLTSSLVEFRPGGAYRTRVGTPPGEPAPFHSGTLSEERRARLQSTLEAARVSEIVGGEDEDFGGTDSYVTVVFTVGDAASVRWVNAATLRASDAWQVLARQLADVTGVEIAIR